VTRLIPAGRCEVCYLDGGLHYSDDGSSFWKCPNAEALLVHRDAVRLAAEAKHRQHEAAVLIVKDAAERMLEVSANNIHAELEAAQIDGTVRGGAFRTAASEGWIEATDKRVMSCDPATRSELKVWRSLIYRKGVA
jgi:hypothetical protein